MATQRLLSPWDKHRVQFLSCYIFHSSLFILLSYEVPDSSNDCMRKSTLGVGVQDGARPLMNDGC